MTNLSRNHDFLRIQPIKCWFKIVTPLAVAILTAHSAQATVNCAGYLPSSYFERIEAQSDNANSDRTKRRATLIDSADGTQRLQNGDGSVLVSGLIDAHILMDKYIFAKKDTSNGQKYGVIDLTGRTIVPFYYDEVATEPDIYTSFIIERSSKNGAIQQGIIDRNGDWIYPTPTSTLSPRQLSQQHLQQHRRRIDNGYDNIISITAVRASDQPNNLQSATIHHAHYDSNDDRDYFLITALSGDNNGKIGLLDDNGDWVIPQNYDAIQPLNPCSGQPLYLQVSANQQSALMDQHQRLIIPFATHQHIELFGVNEPPLFLISTLKAGSTATGMSEDIQDDIVSAKIADSAGNVIITSESPITKLLYHQYYLYKQSGKFGVMDDQGKIKLKPQFDDYQDGGDEVWMIKKGKRVRLKSLMKLS